MCQIANVNAPRVPPIDGCGWGWGSCGPVVVAKAARASKQASESLEACSLKYESEKRVYRHHGRVAGEGRRVVAPPCPRSTARLRRSPIGRVESFRSWSSYLFRERPGERRHVQSGGRFSDTLMWS